MQAGLAAGQLGNGGTDGSVPARTVPPRPGLALAGPLRPALARMRAADPGEVFGGGPVGVLGRPVGMDRRVWRRGAGDPVGGADPSGERGACGADASGVRVHVSSVLRAALDSRRCWVVGGRVVNRRLLRAARAAAYGPSVGVGGWVGVPLLAGRFVAGRFGPLAGWPIRAGC